MESPRVYVSRPSEVEAIQWTGENLKAIQAFVWPQSPTYRTKSSGEPPVLVVGVRDAEAEKRWPNIGPHVKEEVVATGSWLTRLSNGDLIVLDDRTFQTQYDTEAPPTFRALPPSWLPERQPEASDDGAVPPREIV